MPRDSAAADRPASYLVGTAAAFPLFFRDRTKPINQLPFSPSAKFPKSGSSCESRVSSDDGVGKDGNPRLSRAGDAAPVTWPVWLGETRISTCRGALARHQTAVIQSP